MGFGTVAASFRFVSSPSLQASWLAVYFNELLIEVNLSLRLVPRPLTAAIMANEIPAAISPYSIAVAPDSSDKNFKKIRCNYASH